MCPVVQSCFPWPPLVFREVEQVVVGLSHLYSEGGKGRRKQPIRSVQGRVLNRKKVEAATVKRGTVLARVTSQSCPSSWAMLAFSQGWELENRLPGGNLNADGAVKLMEGCFWCQEVSLLLYNFQLNTSLY